MRSLVTNRYLPSMGYNYFDAGEAEGEVAGIVKRELEAFINQLFPTVWEKYKISVCRMPWRRMFEVDLSLEEIAE